MHEANDVLISGPGTGAGRRSDEQHTSFTICRDSDSELDGETLMVMRGISNRVKWRGPRFTKTVTTIMQVDIRVVWTAQGVP